MKYCTKCGAELAPDTEICGNCGCLVPGMRPADKKEEGGRGAFIPVLVMFVAVFVLCAVSLRGLPAPAPIPTASISFGDFTTDGFTIENPRNAQAELDALRREFDAEHERLINMPDDPTVQIGNLEIDGLLQYKSSYQTEFDDFAQRIADWANGEAARSNDVLAAFGCTAFFAVVAIAAVIVEYRPAKGRKEQK